MKSGMVIRGIMLVIVAAWTASASAYTIFPNADTRSVETFALVDAGPNGSDMQNADDTVDPSNEFDPWTVDLSANAGVSGFGVALGQGNQNSNWLDDGMDTTGMFASGYGRAEAFAGGGGTFSQARGFSRAMMGIRVDDLMDGETLPFRFIGELASTGASVLVRLIDNDGTDLYNFSDPTVFNDVFEITGTGSSYELTMIVEVEALATDSLRGAQLVDGMYNARLEVIPEPASLSLLALGGLALCRRRG